MALIPIQTQAIQAAVIPAQAQSLPAQPTPTAQPPALVPAKSAAINSATEPTKTEPTKKISNRDRRKATKLYLRAAKLYEKSQFEAAQALDEKAAALDPLNPDYPAGAAIARSHAVTQWVQRAAKTRTLGDSATAREELAHALNLDPKNPIVTQHLNELANDGTLALDEPRPLYLDTANRLAPLIHLAPLPGPFSFHEHIESRALIRDFYKTYGLQVSFDNSLTSQNLRFDIDALPFAQAAELFGQVTHTFYVPLDAHRVLVARDNSDTRQQFMRTELETIYLPGLNEKEITDILKVVKEMFDLQQAAAEPTAGTITVRAQPLTLDSLNTTLRLLVDGQSQIMLDVRMIELAKMRGRNTGVDLPQQLTIFNVGIAEQALLSANQALVQQIISSGLASANDPLAILGILLASGQVTSPLLTSLVNNGVGVFGGGASLTGVTPLTSTVHLNVNSSESRALDDVQLRLGDKEAGTIKLGSRYPITTSSFSSGITIPKNIPGLNTPGASSSISSLASGLLGGLDAAPMIEYQDIGLTLKATPNVLRNDKIALTLDLKVTSLAGPSVNGIPVLNNQAYSGIVTLKDGEAVVVASELSKQESHALSGIPGLTEIPGLNNVTDVNNQLNYASLIIVITPHVVRGTQAGGHSPILRIDRKGTGR